MAAVTHLIVLWWWCNFALFPARSKINTAPPSCSIYDDVARGFKAPDRAREGYGRLQLPI